MTMTKREIEAAIIALQTYDGCSDVICQDVTGDHCECGRIIQRAFKAVPRADGEGKNDD